MDRLTKETNKNRIFFFICIILCFTLTACGSSKRKLTKKDAGNPYSDWGKCATGSSKYLDGDTVLVSIFLEDTHASWTDDEIKLVKNNMKIACNYLKKQGEKYGKDVNLIYDIDAHEDLCYHLKYNKPYPGTSSYEGELSADNEVANLIEYVNDFENDEIPIKAIMEKYNVNSIGFMVFIDSLSDAAITYPYYDDYYNGFLYTETCYITTKWKSIREYITPDTYAHEILHLFGARDLYQVSGRDGISKSLIDYVYKEEPDEIMLGASTDGVAWKKFITADISDITAYFLGWRYSFAGIEKYPHLQKVNNAVFAHINLEGAEYSEYILPARQITQKKFIVNIVSSVISLLIILFTFIYNFRRRKKFNGETNVQSNTIMIDYDELDDYMNKGGD